MATEALVRHVKGLIVLGRSGKVDEAYAGYGALFESPEFGTYPIDERRHAIKLVVNAKSPPNRPPAALVDAHRRAIGPLQAMIQAQNEPADYELLGICHVFVGDEGHAGDVFRQGLAIERARNPQSVLCGSLMKWVAAV